MSAGTLEATPKAPPKANAAPARASSLLLASFAAVYILWGSTFFAIRIGVESLPPLVLAGLRHLSVGRLVFYPVFRRVSREKPTLTPPSGARRLLRVSCCSYAAMTR
jgi:drug/metabolite transporter (DMT)-like permease